MFTVSDACYRTWKRVARHETTSERHRPRSCGAGVWRRPRRRDPRGSRSGARAGTAPPAQTDGAARWRVQLETGKTRAARLSCVDRRRLLRDDSVPRPTSPRGLPAATGRALAGPQQGPGSGALEADEQRPSERCDVARRAYDYEDHDPWHQLCKSASARSRAFSSNDQRPPLACAITIYMIIVGDAQFWTARGSVAAPPAVGGESGERFFSQPIRVPLSGCRHMVHRYTRTPLYSTTCELPKFRLSRPDFH